MRRSYGRFKKQIWPSARSQRGTEIPDYTELQFPGSNPIAFTPARPAPLVGQNLSKVAVPPDLEAYLSRDELSRTPCVPLDAERMGLPRRLLEALGAKGVGQLTPVQAKLLQHMHALHDCAVCAPTGSGKTLAMCAGLVAKLMRQGPPVVFSSVFLAPTADLAYQTAAWLRELWWDPSDDRLVFAATEDTHPDDVHAALQCPDLTEPDSDTTPSCAPYIVVGTPGVMWRHYCRRRRERDENVPAEKRIGGETSRHLKAFGVYTGVDVFLCDEVDAVLPPNDRGAPGNMLLAELYSQYRYQAPLQVVLASATLAPQTVNHVRRFMRRSVFAETAVRIFEDEIEDVRKDALRRAPPSGAPARQIGVASSVSHRFYLADTAGDQADAIRDAVEATGFGVMSLAPASEDSGSEGRRIATGRAAQHTAAPEAAMELAPGNTTTALSGESDRLGRVHALVVLPASADAVAFARNVLGQLRPRPRVVFGSAAGGDRAALEARARGRLPELPEPVNSTASIESASGLTASAPSQLMEEPRATFFVCSQSSIRGIDVAVLTHVFVLARPATTLEYVHWAGRVGRMGRSGHAVCVLPRAFARQMSQFCELLSIPFRLAKTRFAAVDVPHYDRW